MRDLGQLKQVSNNCIYGQRSRLTGKKVETVNKDDMKKYSIDEIIDRVEDGDLSLLNLLNIAYTEIKTKSGDRRISFKYNRTEFTVNIINDIPENKEKKVNTKIQYISDGSYLISEIDENGKELRQLHYSADGTLQNILEYTYNEDGTVTHTSKNASGVAIQMTNLDTDGNVIHNAWFDNNGALMETADYTRDENGVETTITKDANGVIRHKFVYDLNNNIRIADEIYNEKGVLEQYSKYEYSQDGSMTETKYDSGGKVVTVTKYNADGEIDSIEYYGGTENIIEETNFYYDEEGNRLSITQNAQNDILVFSKFNKNGLRIFNYDAKSYSLQKLYDVRDMIVEQLDCIIRQLNNMHTPVPPKAADYNQNDNKSNDAYNDALRQYNEEMTKYNNALSRLYEKFMKLQLMLKQINKQIKELENLYDSKNIKAIDRKDDNFGEVDDKIIKEMFKLSDTSITQDMKLKM